MANSGGGGSIRRLNHEDNVENGRVPLLSPLESSNDESYSEQHVPNNESSGASHEIASNGMDDVPGCEQADESYLDLVHLVAILLMPTLAQVGKEWNDVIRLSYINTFPYERNRRGHDDESLPSQLEMSKLSTLLHDVLSGMLTSISSSRRHDEASLTSTRAPLEMMIDLLLAHGEDQRANDITLVKEMFEAAHSSTGLFDLESLVRALTHDLLGWTAVARKPTAAAEAMLPFGRALDTKKFSNEKGSSIAEDGTESNGRDMVVGTESTNGESDRYQVEEGEDPIFPASLDLDLSKHSNPSDMAMEDEDDRTKTNAHAVTAREFVVGPAPTLAICVVCLHILQVRSSLDPLAVSKPYTRLTFGRNVLVVALPNPSHVDWMSSHSSVNEFWEQCFPSIATANLCSPLVCKDTIFYQFAFK